jgi:serine/threonine-protein kinase HipA
MTTELLAVVEGVVLGRITEQTRSGGTLSFQYESSWLALNQAFALSVSMPLSEAHYKHRVIRPFLLNLLPENQAVLRRWEMEFHASASNPAHPDSRLACHGKELSPR